MGVDVEVVVDEAAEVNGLMAMIFLPPEPVMNTNCFPVAWRDAANAGGTWRNKVILIQNYIQKFRRRFKEF